VRQAGKWEPGKWGRGRRPREQDPREQGLLAGRAAGHGQAFFEAIGEPETLTRRVPSCPDWTVGELTQHLGAVYHRTRTKAGAVPADEPWAP